MSNYDYIIDKGSKTFYQLGKGSWYILSSNLEAFNNSDHLSSIILRDCFHLDGCSKTRQQEIIDHVNKRLAPDLFSAFGASKTEDLVIVNDGCDDLTICKVKKYRCIGLRYHDKESKEYKEEMEYLNRHLEDTDLNKKWYNPDDYKKYAEWEKY